MRPYFAAALLSVICLAAVPALGSDGTAVGVDPDAVARLDGSDRVLFVGADVSVGERIVTAARGQVQIIFADQTKLVVGPNSSLLIEDFLLRGDGDASKVTINALAGTFRFITGNSAKDAYEIKTPTGTIGVRGTAFDLTVFDLGGYLLLHHGAVTVCNIAGICIDVTDRCEVGAYGMDDAVVIGAFENRDAVMDLFPYVRFQPVLDQFRIVNARQCLLDSLPATPTSITPGESGDDDREPPQDDPVTEDPPDPTGDPGHDPGPGSDPGPGPVDPGTDPGGDLPDPSTDPGHDPDPATDPGPGPVDPIVDTGGTDPPGASPDPDPVTDPGVDPGPGPGRR